MKWTRLAPLLVVPVLALLFLGQSFRPPAAEAKPVDIITITPTLCTTFTSSIDWDDDGIVTTADATEAFLNCTGALNDPAVFDRMVGAIRGISSTPADPTRRMDAIAANPPKPSDFTAPAQGTPLDSDAGQLHQEDGEFWVINFVTNDDPLAVYADKGIFTATGTSSIRCGPVIGPDYDISEEDCNDNGVKGDGVVVVKMAANDASRGPAILRLRQGSLEAESDYTIVGEPYRIELTASKPVIQTGAAVCALFSDTPSFLATLGAPQKSPLTAVVKDSDGTAITGALVAFEIEGEEPESAILAMPLTPTLSSPLGINAPNVICGDEDPGPITVRARISKEAAPGVVLDAAARERDMEIEMTVKGPPTDMTLSASPTSLVCDGTATSTVSAALTDADGNPAVDGNVVAFSVLALGVVNPLEGKSAGGAATTVVTPLSDIARGVTVDAVLMVPKLVIDYDDLTDDEIDSCAEGILISPCPVHTEIMVPTTIEKTVLVECSTAQPAPPEVPGGPSGPTISPPSTGDGGYLQ
jgi:hypothetical protein